MGKNSAEYMRAYRARKKATADISQYPSVMRQRIEELEAEVARLEAINQAHRERFVAHGRPVAGMSQAERDAILRKINRGG